jgi:hypothetical protein
MTILPRYRTSRTVPDDVDETVTGLRSPGRIPGPLDFANGQPIIPPD